MEEIKVTRRESEPSSRPHDEPSGPAYRGPSNPDHKMPDPEEDKSIGELVHELIEEGKAYAQAEVDLYKTIATVKAKALAMPAAMLFGSLLFLQATINLLGVVLYMWLEPLIGPFLAGLAALLLMGAVAGALAMIAISKIREEL